MQFEESERDAIKLTAEERDAILNWTPTAEERLASAWTTVLAEWLLLDTDLRSNAIGSWLDDPTDAPPPILPQGKFADAVRDYVYIRDRIKRDSVKSDTKSDTAKKAKKKSYKRPMNTAAADCCRRFKAQKGVSPMKSIVEEYVHQTGVGKLSSIMRVLNDNPEHWKDDTKTT